MRTALLVATVAFLCSATVHAADEKPGQAAAKSKISQVTLYRSQAMVTREVALPEDSGDLSLEINDLPPQIIPGSIFASSNDVRISSVRFSTDYAAVELPKDKIGQIEKRLQEIQVEMTKIEMARSIQSQKLEFLKRLETQYVTKLGPSATALTEKEVSIGGFDFKTIAEMTDFIFKQRDSMGAQAIALDDQMRKLQEEMDKKNEELSAIRHDYGIEDTNIAVQQAAQADIGGRNTVRKAIVYFSKEKKGPASLLLSYLVGNAGWSPEYNLRLEDDGKQLNVEYIAHVNQLTGEDWNAVSLTLSTATPSMNAGVPILAPMWVKLVPGAGKVVQPTMAEAADSNANPLASNWRARSDNASKFKQQKSNDLFVGNISLNKGANELQYVEFTAGKDALKRWYEDIRRIDQQMAVEYPIPEKVTLASRNDNQMVQILSKSLASSLYYEAVPLLAGFVSRGVQALNTIDQPLLEGEYSAFAEGQYVGKGSLPVTATGQTLVLGFGIDPQLRCRRELLDKVESKSWGERKETYKYRIVLDNYKAEEVTVRLLDRIPVTKDKGLSIELKEGRDQLCKDAEYREMDFPNGILRWDIALPPSSSGSKSTKFDYSYDMEFDSDMQINARGEELDAKLKTDLIELELRRQCK